MVFHFVLWCYGRRRFMVELTLYQQGLLAVIVIRPKSNSRQTTPGVSLSILMPMVVWEQ